MAELHEAIRLHHIREDEEELGNLFQEQSVVDPQSTTKQPKTQVLDEQVIW